MVKKYLLRTLSIAILVTVMAALSSFIDKQELFKETAPGTITFSAENDRYQAKGTFDNWKFSKAEMKERNNLETFTAEILVDMSSVNEKSSKLTSHLKASDYFFIDQFPVCKVSIGKIEKGKGDKYNANAILDLKGVKAEVPVSFIVKRINPVIVKGHMHVDRLLHKVGVENKKTTTKVEVDFEAELPYKIK
ncbi:MAG: YceI family protein [Cyclobacteriaceae bacterium]